MNASLTLNAHEVAGFYQPGTQPDIQDYLESVMAEYQTKNDQCLFLPSLLSLSECFQTSAVEVHTALEALKRQRGCDVFIMGFDSPITLWYPTRIR